MLNSRGQPEMGHNFMKPEASGRCGVSCDDANTHFRKPEVTGEGTNWTKPEVTFSSQSHAGSSKNQKPPESIERKRRIKEGRSKRDGSYFGKVSKAT